MDNRWKIWVSLNWPIFMPKNLQHTINSPNFGKILKVEKVFWSSWNLSVSECKFFCLVCGGALTLTQNQMERGRKRRTKAKTKTISSHSHTPRFLRFRPVEKISNQDYVTVILSEHFPSKHTSYEFARFISSSVICFPQLMLEQFQHLKKRFQVTGLHISIFWDRSSLISFLPLTVLLVFCLQEPQVLLLDLNLSHAVYVHHSGGFHLHFCLLLHLCLACLWLLPVQPYRWCLGDTSRLRWSLSVTFGRQQGSLLPLLPGCHSGF